MIYWICLWFIEGIKKLTNKGGGKMTIEKLEEFLNEMWVHSPPLGAQANFNRIEKHDTM